MQNLLMKIYNHISKLAVLLLTSVLFVFNSCETKTEQKIVDPDPLPTWNEGAAKQQIITFLNNVSNPSHADFVLEADRIATIDNDGTLWTERPVPPQVFYILEYAKDLAQQDPALAEKEPYKSLLANDFESIKKQGNEAVMKMAAQTLTGMDEATYRKSVQNWFASGKHPGKNKLFKDLKYQPMNELLALLRSKGFKIFLVSGGSRDFMRAFSVAEYGIPEYQIVGSTFKMQFNKETHKIERLPELEFMNNYEGKAVGIYNYVGKTPVFVAGNSDGDLQMMQYAEAGGEPFLNILVTHNDEIREYKYNDDTQADEKTEALKQCNEKENWVKVDMKHDWKKIYAFE